MLLEIQTLVEKGRLKKIEAAVQSAVDAGTSPADILAAMTAAMDAVGEGFQRNELYVPEMLVAAKTMQKGVAVLRPYLAQGEVGRCGKFIIGTVCGDLHDIGKNLVAMMLESAGFEVIDLGVDVPAEKYAETLRANPDCRFVGLSALLTTAMDAMRQTVEALRAVSGAAVTVMVGGAPVTPAFAERIGADLYTENAAAAANAARARALG